MPASIGAKENDLEVHPLDPGDAPITEAIRQMSSAAKGVPPGTDADAVVDSELRVRGLRGLRVADVSVAPAILSGPGSNALAYMIGGRAAEFIKADI